MLEIEFLKSEVGNGQNIQMWFDRWDPDGALFEKYGFRVIYDAHSNLKAKLSTVLKNGEWQ